MTQQSNKVWFITGASRGFGRVWAEAALQRGDKVAATARTLDNIAALSEKYGDNVLTLQLDVTRADQVKAAVNEAYAHFGRLDIVVNNAGYSLVGTIEEAAADEIRALYETNVLGPVAVIQAVLPLLRNPYYHINLRDAWHNVVVADSYAHTSLYVDGVLIYSWTYGGSSNCYNGNNYFLIGGGTDMQYATGKIDDIGIWSRALSPCEIAAIYTSRVITPMTNPGDYTTVTGSVATFNVSDTLSGATYQWQENNGSGFINLSDAGAYSGVTTQTLTINPVSASMNNNLYRCLRIGTTACANDTSAQARLTLSGLSISSANAIATTVIIYPNPAAEHIWVEANEIIKNIEVYDITGRKVLAISANDQRLSVNIAQLESGTYFMRINGLHTQRFIKK